MQLVTPQRLIACVLAVAGAVVVGGCGSTTDVDSRGPCAAAAPLAASIGPLDPSVPVGGQIQLNVLLRCGADGPTVSTNWVWSSSNSSVVSVDANGLATAISRGIATVTATSLRYRDVMASTAVNTRVTNTSLPRVTPISLIMAPGTTEQFRATLSAEPNAPIVWSIDPPDVATIDQTGLVYVPRCGLLGNAVITARYAVDPTVSATAALTVRYAGAGNITTQFIRDSITAQPVDFSRVRGTIAIRVALDDRLVECGGLSRVDVVVRSAGRDDMVMAGELPTYPETKVDLFFNTTARAANDQPRTPNGSYSIIARAFDPKGSLIEEAAPILVTFDNP